MSAYYQRRQPLTLAPTNRLIHGITAMILVLCSLQVSNSHATSTASTYTVAQTVPSEATQVLDQLHQHAAEAKWDAYFSLYLPNAIFIGTDATEYWDMPTFEQYARPTNGWRYQLTDRRWVQHNDVIVFDELLHHQHYGVSRGSGTLIKTDNGWKVAQYHLSFPIPNSIAKKVTSQIKTHTQP